MLWPVLFGGGAYLATGSYAPAVAFGAIGLVVWGIRRWVSANTSPMTPWGMGLLY